ncbi:hypothetical protein ACROYT_G003272 [Oculina patagonica]
MKATLVLCVLLGMLHTALLRHVGRRRWDSPEEQNHYLPCTSHESEEIAMCLNGGECFAVELGVLGRNFGCTCADGYEGTRCEYENVVPDIFG